MRSTAQSLHRPGYTLIELIVAVSVSGVLMAGLSSTMFIAFQASDTSNTPAAATLEAHTSLTHLSAELQYAQRLIAADNRTIRFTVPDRDSDLGSETIRYAWSGTAGDPLTRRYNGGTVATVAEDVHEFKLEYYRPDSAVEYVNVRLQISSDSETSMETAIPLLNRP